MRTCTADAVLSGRLAPALAGRQLIVVSNRGPLVHEWGPDGAVVTRHPVSGVVTALDPVLRVLGGTWIARAFGDADRQIVDARDHVKVDDPAGGYTCRPVWLTRVEERGHYDGFSNTGLWPLCHLAFETPRFRRSDWVQYEAVNRRFADAVVSEARGPDPIVFVQDYQFALLARLVRERLPHASIASFWHIPWPNRSRFERCPYAREIVESMLAADVVGFQTAEHVQHFLACVRALRGPRVDAAMASVTFNGVTAAVAAFPISVEFPSRWAASAPVPEECRGELASRLGFNPDRPIVVSLDRLDYTKGIEERLAAIRRLLARGAGHCRMPVFVQVAAPTRQRVAGYRDFAARTRAQATWLNERFGTPDYQPIVWFEDYLEPQDVFRVYRAADVCHVNSLDDGMNLVAKEFAAARSDERGVLVLSRFTGAARALDGALLVNPYDVDGAADSLAEALRMPVPEQNVRMRSMRAHLRSHTVFHWAEDILTAAASAREGSRSVTTMFPA